MMLAVNNGRLGNQLFQSLGINHHFPEQRRILFGFRDLARLSDPESRGGARLVPLPKHALMLVSYLLRWLARWRVIGRVVEIHDGLRWKLEVRSGLVPNVFAVIDAYFQHADAMRGVEPPECLRIRAEHLEAARRWMQTHVPSERTPVFVQVRRGDYLHWPSVDAPAVLELDWYRRAMALLELDVRQPMYIVLTDDAQYAQAAFGEDPRFVISGQSAQFDLAVMALCHAGIMSASSLAAWGALFAKQTRSQAAPFIAPKYWIGHRVGVWKPSGFRFDWITYTE
jgi:hypothetical protein